MIKNFIILASVLISHQALVLAAGCECPSSHRMCIEDCVNTMAKCVTNCKTENTETCVNSCLESYWTILKSADTSKDRQELAEGSLVPTKILRRGHHEADEMENGSHKDQHEEHSSGKNHSDDDHSNQNESPVKVYTTVTTHTTLFAEPTQDPNPRPSENPTQSGTNEGEKDHKGDKSMAITDRGSFTVMIAALALTSVCLFTV